MSASVLSWLRTTAPRSSLGCSTRCRRGSTASTGISSSSTTTPRTRHWRSPRVLPHADLCRDGTQHWVCGGSQRRRCGGGRRHGGPGRTLTCGWTRAAWSGCWGPWRTPGTGIAVPRLYDRRGVLNQLMRREPTVWGSLLETIIGAQRLGRVWDVGQLVADPAEYTSERTTDWAEGSTQLHQSGVSRRLRPLGRVVLPLLRGDRVRAAST